MFYAIGNCRFIFKLVYVVIIMNFNYVFFFNVAEYYRFMFDDIISFDNVRYVKGFENTNAIIRNIAKVHWSRTINKTIKLPLKQIWNKYYYNDFTNDKENVFVFHGSFYFLRDMGYFDSLKSKYPNCKCIMFLTDTVDSYYKIFRFHYAGQFDISYLKEKFDVILSYNMYDAEKYGFYYYPLWYSSVQIKNNTIESDVFFIGRAKDRLDKIHDAYINLKKKGLACKFIIYDVPRGECKYEDILYNKFLTYKEVLNYVGGTKAILEITQGGAHGFSLRVLEALTYDKILITDNNFLYDKRYFPYCNSKKFIKLDDIPNFTQKEFYDVAKERFYYRGEYSPVNLLREIEKIINI